MRSVLDEPAGGVASEMVSTKRWLTAPHDLSKTRGLLSDAIERAETAERKRRDLVPADAGDAVLLQRFRAELAHVASELRAEQRVFNQMLTYILLAMRHPPSASGSRSSACELNRWGAR